MCLDPIWLIASVEEGGLMGITQQLEQCHSLGMNTNQGQFMSHAMQPDQPSSNNLLYQTSPTNPFQTTRWPVSDPNNVPGWTNYPLVPVTVRSE